MDESLLQKAIRAMVAAAGYKGFTRVRLNIVRPIKPRKAYE